MKTYFTGLMLLIALIMLSNLVFAGGMDKQSAISSMSKIMHGMNHYPGDADKKSLKDIMNHSEQGSHHHTLASSMMNLEHSVSSKDAPHLKAIINDKNASKEEQDLARIILNMNHKPGDADKERLKMMMH